MKRKNIYLGIFCMAVSFSFTALGESVISDYEAGKLDWGALLLKFEGTGIMKDDEKDYTAAVLRAKKNATEIAVKILQPLCVESGLKCSGLYGKVLKNRRSKNTEYINSGKVKVYYHLSLLDVVPGEYGGSASSVNTYGAQQKSGLIIKVVGKAKPSIVYSIYNDKGEQLFGIGNVPISAQKLNIMGRWFKKLPDNRAKDVVGVSPATLELQANGVGRYVVKQDAWEKALKEAGSAIIAGKIAIHLNK